jgi:cytochrome c-type biogenesis protein CcmH/NrfG
MNNPYAILGVPAGASKEQINNAYRNLARQYSEQGNTAALDELNRAYDAVIMTAAGSGSYNTYSPYEQAYQNDYSFIRSRISSGKYEDALTLLEGMPESSRNAEWYYLKGVVYNRQGWLEQSAELFGRACSLDPSNREYKQAYDDALYRQNGGYKTKRSSSGGSDNCSFCKICTGLFCADTCCECMGGDLISCC